MIGQSPPNGKIRRSECDSLGFELVHLFLGLLTHFFAALHLSCQLFIGQLDLTLELLQTKYVSPCGSV